jgi:pimeloyl-ACP methyl ester carboxylesterase
VADALAEQGQDAIVPEIRSLEHEGPPYWERHVEAITRAIKGEASDAVILVGHSGAGRLLPICGERIPAEIQAYVFVDSDVPSSTESRLDAMPEEMAQEFRGAAEDGLLPPWPEEVFEDEVKNDEVRGRLVSELLPLPLAVYEEAIPLPEGWPNARCAYIRLSHRYPDAEALAQERGWKIHRFDADHFHILVAPNEIASALIASALTKD